MTEANSSQNKQRAPVLGCLSVLLTLLWLGTAGQISFAVQANDQNADALGGHKYPWYDAETRAVKPLKQEPGNKPKSSEREAVPIAKPKPNITTGANNSGAGGGAGTGARSDEAGLMFFVLIAAIILVLIVVLVLTFLYIESRESDLSVPSSERSRKQSIEQLPFDLDPAANGDFRTAADAAYRSGDLRKAIVYLYSHVLVTLDQNRLIRLRKGKTNRQYLKEVQRHKGLSGYFQQVMLPFESVFFGDHEMDADQFQQCWAGSNGFHSNVKDNAEVLLG